MKVLFPARCVLARRKTALVFATSMLVALGAGCASTEEGGEGPPPASRGDDRFSYEMDLETEGKYLDAIDAYREIAGDPGASAETRAEALFRTGRCLEEQGDLAEARKAYRALLSHPLLSADDKRLPAPGTLPLHLRMRAEAGLGRAEGDPVLFYTSLARSGTLAQQTAAVRSIARLKDPRGRDGLHAVLAGEDLPAGLREEAKEALAALDRAENRARKQ